MRLNTEAGAPMPSASVSTATAVKPGFFSNWRKANLRSFITQCLHGINFRRAARGQPASQQGGGDQQRDDARKRQRVRRRDAVKLARDETRCHKAPGESGNTAKNDRLHSLPDDQPVNGTSLGTERDA